MLRISKAQQNATNFYEILCTLQKYLANCFYIVQAFLYFGIILFFASEIILKGWIFKVKQIFL